MTTPPPGPRDVVQVRGPDAATYLQGQLSADVDALAVGGSALALLLEPTGKLCAVLDVRRPGDEDFTLEVDPGAGPVVAARLRRFLLRTKATVVEVPADESSGGGGSGGGGSGEVARIQSGWPAYGAEYGGEHSGEVVPAEIGSWLIDAAVSFTKGCYVGQELTARIDSRGGNVPRRLRVLRLPGVAAGAAGSPRPGDRLAVAGEEEAGPRGTLTSVAADPADPDGGFVALAYLHRTVAADVRLVLWPG